MIDVHDISAGRSRWQITLPTIDVRSNPFVVVVVVVDVVRDATAVQ